ncbi:hypothetical protein RAJCM14343_3944 [Rhodococcus aetherivorans]|uniref:WXG100 family type VII secretion target n=1 Tax=Rhodococcus aetherivorans TaxID=191292 RepID=A0ABQ0YQZ3_9NOCA|nr:hypothetical protein [Rhodococcus aetherivorans]ETT25275.1 hypothetical protein RR21198_4015 [Rhodococcus rhodochrous ATCC 21198]NGP28452.1 hypothetical protein [Rhodococcus aetherivorans]GES38679.1 hypothetical protein RAJCM14343_3944 [Rhodococcus aetherivorans]
MSIDAEYAWSEEVNNSEREAESLESEVDALTHDLSDLIHTIRDLRTVSFNDDVEDYDIRHKAQQLWDAVSSGVSQIRRDINDARDSIQDTRRVVDFYR